MLKKDQLLSLSLSPSNPSPLTSSMASTHNTINATTTLSFTVLNAAPWKVGWNVKKKNPLSPSIPPTHSPLPMASTHNTINATTTLPFTLLNAAPQQPSLGKRFRGPSLNYYSPVTNWKDTLSCSFSWYVNLSSGKNWSISKTPLVAQWSSPNKKTKESKWNSGSGPLFISLSRVVYWSP